MILKELNLIGFGKFENKKIQLAKGLNVIYGENETGKSTLHSFIEGIFFGFLRPNVTSALYNEEHDKYNPWNKSRYAGIISFEFEGKDYRIERDFAKGAEDTKIFEEITGKEISKTIDIGKTRIPQPGIHFFGFNTRVFSNTIFIKQLQSRTDKELANDLREKLVNVNTGLDDNISVDKAISDIDTALSEIGSEIAPTRPYALNIKEIERLEKEKTIIEIEKKDYQVYLEEKFNLEEINKNKKENLVILKEDLSRLVILEKKEILKDGEKVIKEIDNLKEEKERLKDFAFISKVDYEEAIRLKENIGYSNKNIKEVEGNLEGIESKIKTFDFGNTQVEDERRLKGLNEDYNYYEGLESEKQKIQYNRDDNYIKILQRDKKANQDKGKSHKRNNFLFLLICFLILGVLYIYNIGGPLLFIPLVLIGIIPVYYILGEKKIKSEEDTIDEELEEINSKEKLNNDRIKEINKIQESLLAKNNFNTKQELNNSIDKLGIKIYNKLEKKKQLDELKIDKLKMEEKLKEDISKRDRNIKIFNEILGKNNCKDLKALSIALDKKDLYEASIKGIISKEELLSKTLGKYTIDELYEETDKIQIDLDFEIETNKEKLVEKIQVEKDTISQINLKLATIEEKIKTLDKKISRLVEIEEEIYKKEVYKKELDKKILALNLAKSTIKELSEEIHTEFAPNINRKLGKIVEKITCGKYNNIKISEDLDISLENPSSQEIVKIDNLSGGTIDQLYFALRFGIMDEITEKNLPLFLDDCFMQYDGKRLKNVLDFLIKNSGQRQILLFTCHKREKKTLEDLGVNFNFINLLKV